MRHKVLILGASGMLGHKLSQRLSRRFEVVGTLRGHDDEGLLASRLGGIRIVPEVRAEDLDALSRLITASAPQVVVNCIGIVKQLDAASKPLPSIAVNALLPHQLAELARAGGARLVHFSTDCVFSGTKGNYAQDEPSDAADLYGRTKFLGEVDAPRCLTIRSSIIGHELRNHTGLIDWFLSQRGGAIRGFTRAVYSGLTTLAMAEVVERAIADWPDLEGVWQVSSEPISKYDLLCMVNRVYGLGVRIDRDEDFVCDRSLDSTAFRSRTGWAPPAWETMVQQMHDDYVCSRY